VQAETGYKDWNYDQPELTSTIEASRMAVALLSLGELTAQTIGACLVRSLGFQEKRG
jgi:hypothetical protein